MPNFNLTGTSEPASLSSLWTKRADKWTARAVKAAAEFRTAEELSADAENDGNAPEIVVTMTASEGARAAENERKFTKCANWAAKRAADGYQTAPRDDWRKKELAKLRAMLTAGKIKANVYRKAVGAVFHAENEEAYRKG